MANTKQARSRSKAYLWLIVAICWLLVFALRLWNDLASSRHVMSNYNKAFDFVVYPLVVTVTFAAYFRVRSVEKSKYER